MSKNNSNLPLWLFTIIWISLIVISAMPFTEIVGSDVVGITGIMVGGFVGLVAVDKWKSLKLKYGNKELSATQEISIKDIIKSGVNNGNTKKSSSLDNISIKENIKSFEPKEN